MIPDFIKLTEGNVEVCMQIATEEQGCFSVSIYHETTMEVYSNDYMDPDAVALLVSAFTQWQAESRWEL